MANIQERTTASGEKRYRVQVRLKGRPTQTASFRRLTDAKRWAQTVEADLRRGRHFPTSEARRRTLSELIDRYVDEVLPQLSANEQRNRKSQLQWWSNHIGNLALVDLRPGLIVDLRTKLAKLGNGRGPASPATQNRYVAALSTALTYGVSDLEWLPANPAKQLRRVSEPRGRTRFLDDDERTRLLEACKKSPEPRLYSIVLLAITTGMRQGELLGLQWQDLDLDTGFATVRNSKNGHQRRVPIAGPAFDVLASSAPTGRRKTESVFGNQDGIPTWPRKAWDQALEQAGIEDFRFHDCRHTAASYLAQSGARLHDIAEILGHRTLQMVQRYAHLTDRRTAAVAQRMVDMFLKPTDDE